MKNNINQALIASYNGIEIPKMKEVTKENIFLAYSGEREVYQEIKAAKQKAQTEMLENQIEIKPKLFSYHAKGESGLEMERTDVITASQKINLSTYNDKDKTWSVMKIYESTPEGIYIADMFIPTSLYGSPENVSVSFEFYSKERLAENGINISTCHPFECYGKNIPANKLLDTKMDYMTNEQLEQFVAQVSHASVKAFYQQMLLQEEERKQQEEMNKQVTL